MGRKSTSSSSSSAGGCCGSDVFEDEHVRAVFLGKVYGLFAGHLLAALGIVLFVTESPTFQWYMASNPGFIWMSILSPLLVLYVAYRLGECRRTCPLDYVFLGLLTVSVGVSLGMVAALTASPAAGLLLAFDAVSALNLAFYTMLARCDSSAAASCGVSFSVAALAMSLALLLRPAWWRCVLAMGAVSFLDSLYLVYITDVMVSPGYAHGNLCPEEYPFATLNIYVDVVRLFAAIGNAVSSSDDADGCDSESA